MNARQARPHSLQKSYPGPCFCCNCNDFICSFGTDPKTQYRAKNAVTGRTIGDLTQYATPYTNCRPAVWPRHGTPIVILMKTNLIYAFAFIILRGIIDTESCMLYAYRYSVLSTLFSCIVRCTRMIADRL